MNRVPSTFGDARLVAEHPGVGLQARPMPETTYIHGTEGAEQERLAALNQLTNRAFVGFLELTSSSRVLEVGSGLGILARDVGAAVPAGQVVGVEYSPAQLAAAISPPQHVCFLRADAHALPFPDARFDVAYCRYVLEHLTDPLHALREMHRVLKPGGKAFVQENDIAVNRFDPDCPAFAAVWQRFATLQQRLGGDALIGRGLFALFKQAGFREIALSTQPEVHHSDCSTFRPWVQNIIGNVESAAARLQDHQLATGEEIDRAVAELRAFMQREDATALFYWNRATGVK